MGGSMRYYVATLADGRQIGQGAKDHREAGELIAQQLSTGDVEVRTMQEIYRMANPEQVAETLRLALSRFDSLRSATRGNIEVAAGYGYRQAEMAQRVDLAQLDRMVEGITALLETIEYDPS